MYSVGCLYRFGDLREWGLSDAGMPLTVSEGSSGASAGRAWPGSTSARPRADYIRMILRCGRTVVPCQFRGTLRPCVRIDCIAAVQRAYRFSRNLDGTLPLVSRRPEKYRQVSGRRACAWMAVCKTVGLAYVGSNPTPATRGNPAQGRYGVPDSFPGHAARCHRKPLPAAGRGIYVGRIQAYLDCIRPG